MKEKIEIALASDKNFCQHLGVTITSVASNFKAKDKFALSFHILDGGIDTVGRQHIINLLSPLHQVKFYKLDLTKFAFLKTDRHVSNAVYYRLYLPILLKSEISKILYLDSDIIVNQDISELWSVDINDKILGGIPELFNARNIEMGLPPDSKTLNSGVLLINLNKWRESQLTNKLLDFIKKNPHKIKFWDQDAINAVLCNQWEELPIKWNLTCDYIYNKRKIKNSEISLSITNPSIVHFNQSFKPWHYKLRHPYKNLYYKYLKMTPWKDYRPPDKNIPNLIRKMIGTIMVYLGMKTH